METHLYTGFRQAFVYVLRAHEIYQLYDFNSLKIAQQFLFPLNQLYNTGKNAYKLQSSIYSKAEDGYFYLSRPRNLLQGKAVPSHSTLRGLLDISLCF